MKKEDKLRIEFFLHAHARACVWTWRGRAVKANMAAAESERLPDEQIIGQMSYVPPPRVLPGTPSNSALSALRDRILLFAATDTTSHMMAQVLQLLSEHPDVQDKVRQEILASRSGQDIAYDQLSALPLLDAVCKETLRLYVAPLLPPSVSD